MGVKVRFGTRADDLRPHGENLRNSSERGPVCDLTAPVRMPPLPRHRAQVPAGAAEAKLTRARRSERDPHPTQRRSMRRIPALSAVAAVIAGLAAPGTAGAAQTGYVVTLQAELGAPCSAAIADVTRDFAIT